MTLAKLIAQSYFLRGKHAQAFGVYAAERSGAPLQAFVRIDDQEITNHNQIREPDHVIVLDRTLIAPRVLTGLSPNGWLILNASGPPDTFADAFGGRRVATLDATATAIVNGLGTRTVPIVNTTMLGATARVLELPFDDVEAALSELGFGGPNIIAARQAFDNVIARHLSGKLAVAPPATASDSVASLLDDFVGASPTIRTGSWATRRPYRRRLTPPCNFACPAGNDVQGFIAAAAEEDYDRALGILLQTSPFPGVCGRVCPAPCMDACNRSDFDSSINIRELERYVADRGKREEGRQARPGEKGVAVVGSGPAGLSAAYHLARLGYPVTLFEAGRELGGVMRTGIPTYRLPRDVLDREINYILDQGVETRVGRAIGREELLEMSRQFAAVFIATGLQESRSLDLGVAQGGSTERVLQGIELLDRVRRGAMSVAGEHVLVIGGGNTAIDAARSARRIGAESVRIIYRRTRREMPAIKEEIEAALEEGVVIDELVSPVRLQEDGAAPRLTCQRMRLGEPDESGRPRPVPETSEDAFFDIRCDRVILALGQSTDLSILPEGAEVRAGQALLGLTGAPVFCGGDFAANEGTVTAAIGNGRRAALHIHRTLTGEDLFEPPVEPVVGPEQITMHLFSYAPREKGDTISTSLRRRTFTEVQRGLIDEPDRHPAALEARRCFSCGVCDACDRCATYCPEGIVIRDGDGYRFDYDYCKGCGICASQCPRSVIYMADL